MKDAKAILETAKAEALRSIESSTSSLGCKLAWFYTHCGEIEMAFFLGALTEIEFEEINAEWKTHKPAA